MGLKMPTCAPYWDVDQVIECLSFGDHRQAVTSALLEAMPNAYGDRPFREIPEPDANPQFKLARIWHKLDTTVQQRILIALAQEGAL